MGNWQGQTSEQDGVRLCGSGSTRQQMNMWVSCVEKLVRARAARDGGQRPRAEDIMKIRSGIPETLRRNNAAGEVAQERPEDGPPGVRRRNFKITRQLSEIISFTENCPKCRDVQNGNVQPWLAHSQ